MGTACGGGIWGNQTQGGNHNKEVVLERSCSGIPPQHPCPTSDPYRHQIYHHATKQVKATYMKVTFLNVLIGGLHLTSVARVLPEGRKYKSSYSSPVS